MKAARLLSVTLIAWAVAAGCQEAPRRPDIATAVTDGPGRSTPSPTAKYDRMTEMLQWARCMRERGVDMPDPPGADVKGWPPELGGKGSALEQRIVEAQFACQRYERFLSDDGVEGPMTIEEFQAWRAYVGCMRDHGIDMDDPDPTNGGSRPMWNIDGKRFPPQELLDQALRACEDLRRAANEVVRRSRPQ